MVFDAIFTASITDTTVHINSCKLLIMWRAFGLLDFAAPIKRRLCMRVVGGDLRHRSGARSNGRAGERVRVLESQLDNLARHYA
jgi:hypothetical protein